VNHAHDLDPLQPYAVRDHERESRHHQLARAGDPTGSSDPRVVSQACRRLPQCGRNPWSGCWISIGNVLDDLAQIGKGSFEPEYVRAIRR
jgi:hypothetical protein